MPDSSYTMPEQLDKLVHFMLDRGSALTQCVPGMLEDITPPYFTRNRYNYVLTTPPDDPTETAVVHLMLKDAAHTTLFAEMSAGSLPEGEVRQIVIPTDSVLFPLSSPTAEAPHALLLHELLVHTHMGATALSAP